MVSSFNPHQLHRFQQPINGCTVWFKNPRKSWTLPENLASWTKCYLMLVDYLVCCLLSYSFLLLHLININISWQLDMFYLIMTPKAFRSKRMIWIFGLILGILVMIGWNSLVVYPNPGINLNRSLKLDNRSLSNLMLDI